MNDDPNARPPVPRMTPEQLGFDQPPTDDDIFGQSGPGAPMHDPELAGDDYFGETAVDATTGETSAPASNGQVEQPNQYTEPAPANAPPRKKVSLASLLGEPSPAPPSEKAPPKAPAAKTPGKPFNWQPILITAGVLGGLYFLMKSQGDD